MIRKFLANRDGNIAMMFGLLLIPMIAAGGMAFDYMYANHIRAEVNEAADSAVLAAARAKMLDATMSDAKAEEIARKYFDENLKGVSRLTVDKFKFKKVPNSDAFEITVEGDISTTLLGVVGQKTIDVDILSQAKIAPPRLLEVVMVLDTTGSMAGQKLDDLKTAANKLVDGIMTTGDTNVKVGVVPFSRYVNVGVSRRNETWLDVDPDSTTTEYKCWNTYPDYTQTNCVTTPSTCTSNNDGITTSYACSQTSCDTDWGDPVEQCGDVTSTNTWHGCVGSRNNPMDVQDRNFNVDPVPGLMNTGCATELLPMTSTKTSVTNTINAMSASGDTYIPAGLTWGLRVISPEVPFTEGETYSNIELKQGMKAIILMTDGANTRSASYPWHDNSSASDANDKTEDVCKEAKKERIVMYTIAFDVSDTTIKDLLKDCATVEQNYYDASNADDMTRAFEDIANNLQELALTK